MSLKDRKVLLTGAGGFIGHHLLDRLDVERADVMVMGRAVCDLEHYDSVERIFKQAKPDIVYHCAGVTSGAGVVVKDPFALVRPNLVLAANVFQAAHLAGAKIVVFPSSTTGYPPLDYPVKEEEYGGPLYDGYRTIGTVKRFVERLAALYPMSTVALRISNVFGPGDNFDPVTSHVIQATVRKVAERQNPIVVWGDGNEVRDALYIDDVIESFIAATAFADKNPPGNFAFNIGRGEGHSVREILAMLIDAENQQVKRKKLYRPKVDYDETKPSLLKRRLVNVEKARMLLDWKAEVGMNKALALTLEAYRKGKK